MDRYASTANLNARRLAWPACSNVRDLGGLTTGTGAVTRFGRFIRANSLARLTESGWQQLRAYGVHTIVDLRAPRETRADGYDIPFGDSPLVHAAISMLPMDQGTEHLFEIASTRGEEYTLFVETYQPAIATIVRTLALAPEGGVLFHCQGGKDRTGILAALLLSLAGVPKGTIVADYALSQHLLRPDWERRVAAALASGAPVPEEPLSEPATMEKLLAHWRERYGGPQGYLESIGVGRKVQEMLHSRLLD
ncbi:MAG: tyrosine-protein phosphatase [Anaerolineae bacterium]|jgi:protein-tyrosine phosphatase|nr:tyrosine-protein phosphatase [Chloroflexota bacterium]